MNDPIPHAINLRKGNFRMLAGEFRRYIKQLLGRFPDDPDIANNGILNKLICKKIVIA
jgi:hypothetical protein